MSFNHNVLDDSMPKSGQSRSVTPNTLHLIRETKTQTTFLFIVFFLMTGVLLVFLLYSISQWLNFKETVNYRYYADGDTMSFTVFRSIISGGLSMILLAISGYLLMKYTTSQEKFCSEPIEENMDDLLSKLRSYWAFTGVVFVIQVIYYTIIIVNSNF